MLLGSLESEQLFSHDKLPIGLCSPNIFFQYLRMGGAKNVYDNKQGALQNGFHIFPEPLSQKYLWAQKHILFARNSCFTMRYNYQFSPNMSTNLLHMKATVSHVDTRFYSVRILFRAFRKNLPKIFSISHLFFH